MKLRDSPPSYNLVLKYRVAGCYQVAMGNNYTSANKAVEIERREREEQTKRERQFVTNVAKKNKKLRNNVRMKQSSRSRKTE